MVQKSFVCSQYSIHCIIVYLEINKEQKSLWGRSLPLVQKIEKWSIFDFHRGEIDA